MGDPVSATERAEEVLARAVAAGHMPLRLVDDRWRDYRRDGETCIDFLRDANLTVIDTDELARLRDGLTRALILADELGGHDIAQRLRAALAHQDGASRVSDGTDGKD